MPTVPSSQLSRRESQVMEVLYRSKGGTAAEVLACIPDPPTYSAVRSILRILTEKGLVKRRLDGRRYIYFPSVATEHASRSAVRRLVKTFFGGSPQRAMATFLDLCSTELPDDEIDRLLEMITRARAEEK